MKKILFLIFTTVSFSTVNTYAYNYFDALYDNNKSSYGTVYIPNEIYYDIAVLAEATIKNNAVAIIENNQISLSAYAPGDTYPLFLYKNHILCRTTLGGPLATSVMIFTKSGIFTMAQASISW